MKLIWGAILLVILIGPYSGTYAEEERSPTAQIDALEEIERLSARLEALRAELETGAGPSTEDLVDLSGEKVGRLEDGDVPASVLARPWYQNIDVSGFGAAWLADSGSDGTRPNPGFVMKESTLFIEAQAWEEVSFFFEVQTTLLQRDHSRDVRTAELYAHFRNILQRWGDDLLSVKIGRVDIPFGEEYLWQDAPDNPLISNSAAYPWLWDEGAVFYGNIRKLGWVAAVMDGSIRRSVEENADKSVTLKLYGRPWKPLFLSGSWMRNGETSAGPFLLGDRMTHIIQHVRLFAREAGKPEVSDVSVNEVVKSSVDLLETPLRSHGIDLRLSLAEELPVVSVNAFSLEEVLLNLLSNARDALEAVPETTSRERTLEVSTELNSANGIPRVGLTVRDKGIGIEEADLDRVLDPFFTTKDPDKGTGLGLPICKSIVEEFGGTLEIVSDPGDGTEVKIFLPVQTSDPVARVPDSRSTTLT